MNIVLVPTCHDYQKLKTVLQNMGHVVVNSIPELEGRACDVWVVPVCDTCVQRIKTKITDHTDVVFVQVAQASHEVFGEWIELDISGSELEQQIVR